MEIVKTNINDLLILKPKVFEDDRGYFMEFFKNSFFKERFKNISFVQENESKSSFGVLRGLHFQKPPFEQSKLVRVICGKVLDVAVDLRKNSKTYGKYESVILSSENKKQFFIPRGFAHGFITLSKNVILNYKVDNYYSLDHEDGINFNDPILDINWMIDYDNIIVSKKDKELPNLKFK